ncbi:MAG: hypothetical protein WB392_11885 [Methanotrichaceae archaeon]
MDDIRPNRWYYALAALVVVAGGAIFFLYLFSNLDNVSRGPTQITVPGSGDLILQDGKYTIIYETENTVGGRIFSTDQDISGLQIELKNKSTGVKLPAYATQGSSTHSIGDRSGRSVMEFVIDRQGIYELSAWYPNGSGPEIVLAIGKDPFDNLMSMIIVGIAIDIGSILIAITIVVTVYQRRKKEGQRLKEQAEAV